MKASVGFMGGGGGKSPLPLAPKPLGELRVVPTIRKVSIISEITESLLPNDDKHDHALSYLISK
jgi:hypothetical protein